MKAFIFDPLWEMLVTEELEGQLNAANIEFHVVKEIAPLRDCKELYEGKEARILCLNPDYVGWKLSADDYKDIPNLVGIFGAATAFNWIDTSFAEDHDIPVCNIRNFSTEAVAEWAITMMTNLARRTPMLIKDNFPLDYDKDFLKYRGIEIKGKRAGIIGLGHIGSAIAERCAGLGMTVTYWSNTRKDNPYKAVELDDLMSNSDVIFPTMALNDETKKLLNDDLVGSMKSSAIFVSIVHELFNQELVLDMVKTGRLFGFGFESKPQTFTTFDGNVWAAPSYAWVTDGSMHNSVAKWVENMVAASKNEFPNRIN